MWQGVVLYSVRTNALSVDGEARYGARRYGVTWCGRAAMWGLGMSDVVDGHLISARHIIAAVWLSWGACDE